jgi:L-rhamnose-H+ transport protein
MLTISAAVINGNFTLPLKIANRWSWENSWALYSVVAFWIVPWALAWFTIPNLTGTYRSLSLPQFLAPLLFGTGWGISQVLLGVSVARVGMALTFSIVIGLSATLGTLIPLFTLHRDALLSAKGAPVLVGITIMIIGIYLAAKAGRERERAQAAPPTADAATPVAGSGYGAALAITISAGILSPMLNYALAFGEPILKKATEQGASRANAPNAV